MSRKGRDANSGMILSPDTFRKLKSMNYAQLNQWVTSIYTSGLADGRAEQAVIEIAPDDIMKELAQIKGIGPKRQEAIREVLVAMQQEAEKGMKHE